MWVGLMPKAVALLLNVVVVATHVSLIEILGHMGLPIGSATSDTIENVRIIIQRSFLFINTFIIVCIISLWKLLVLKQF
jgi:hypothetical protein